jgi:hypothetical protein
VATFEQVRNVELVSGTAEAYVITSNMISANIPVELPHVNVFVLAIADVTDPKQDTLARVAMISDLSTLPIGRDNGIANPGPNGLEYLSSSTVNSYPDLQTANEAATALQDRVNALVVSWITYESEFSAPDPAPAYYTFPTVNPAQLQQLISVYAAAKQARYQDQLASTAAATALAAAQADLTYKQSLVTGAQTVLADAQKVQIDVNALVSQFSSGTSQAGVLYAAGLIFYNANTGGSGASTFLTSLNFYGAAQATIQTQVTASAQYINDATQLVTDAVNYANARNIDVTASSTNLAAAQSTQITAAQTVTAALATEATALVAVLAVCPDFDKTTIPYVPDTGP